MGSIADKAEAPTGPVGGKMALPVNPAAPGEPSKPGPDIAGLPDQHNPAAAPGKTGGQLAPPQGKNA